MASSSEVVRLFLTQHFCCHRTRCLWTQCSVYECRTELGEIKKPSACGHGRVSDRRLALRRKLSSVVCWWPREVGWGVGVKCKREGILVAQQWRIRLRWRRCRDLGVQSLGREDPLEEEMATHSSILAWKIPWTEESGRLQYMGHKRVGHDDWELNNNKCVYHGWFTSLYSRN